MATEKNVVPDRRRIRERRVEVSVSDLLRALEGTINVQMAILEALESMPEACRNARVLVSHTKFAPVMKLDIAVGDSCECPVGKA